MQSISAENNRYRYILTVIDCFSRKAEAIPLKSKRSSDVSEGLELAFKRMGGPPSKLQTDQGTEFLNKDVKKMLAKYSCKLFQTYQDVKAQIVERFNRTLRQKLQKWFAHSGSLRYVDVLPRIVEGYNKTVHSSLKVFSPNDVSHNNEKKVFEIQYRKYLDERAKRHRFKIGEVVRITTYRPRFFKKNIQRNFTTDLFKIVDIFDTNPPTYRLVDNSDSEAIEGSFYESELQKVILPPKDP